jgi:thioredoxin reductase (NADPH)
MITADLLKEVPLFANVPASERESIAARAADIHLLPGEFVIMEGESPAFFVLLSGSMTVLKRIGVRERVVGSYQAPTYIGEVPLLLGSKALASFRVEEPSRVMRLEAADFHELIVACPKLNAEILRMMADRLGRVQQIVVETPVPTVTVVGHESDVACHNVRDFLYRNHVPFTWVDVDDPAREAHPSDDMPSCETGPVVILPDRAQLVAPSFRQLADRLDLNTAPQRELYDVVIVGGGPAGLAAAVYGASEGLCTLLVEKVALGGQAGTSSRIENYLGFPHGLSGDELSALAEQQAVRFGAEVVVARSVETVEPAHESPYHVVVLDGGTRIGAEAIVVAAGVAWRHLPTQGFDSLVGRGIFYGAARIEAHSTRGHDVFVVGGGNSAGQAAVLLSGYANTVTIVVRGHSLAESMSQYLIDQLERKPNVHVMSDAEVVEAQGRDRLEQIVIAHHQSGLRESAMREVHPAHALFVFIGADAETDWLPTAVIRDERGYVCTGRDLLDLERSQGGHWPLPRDPYLLETGVPGIFAAGDVRHGSIKRCASAVGEGSMAIAFIHQYLAQELKAKEGSAAATR